MGIYAKTRLVSVPSPIASAAFTYGFRTKIATASSTSLGHTDVTDANIATTIFGINYPKPRRATKDFGAPKNTETSFIASTSIATALADGWRLLSTKRGSYSHTARTTLVYVEALTQKEIPKSTATYKFAWRMPDQQFKLITDAERAALGIIKIDLTEDVDYCFGVTEKRSKPERVKKRANVSADDDAGEFSTISTFVAYNKLDSLPEGWA